MSSYTVALSGTTSYLTCNLFPPIFLADEKDWEAALLDFTTYNSIPNIIQGVNNKFHYSKDGTPETYKVVSLETGSYEIEDNVRVLEERLGKENITITANNNQLRSELKCQYYVDFSRDSSIGPTLGFAKTNSILEPKKLHISQNTVNIIKVNVINITCNIIDGAFINGSNGHILHSFYPTVEPGFKIVEKPHNLVYLPINASLVSNIALNVLDQDGDPIDFRGETITVRIHLRRRE